jgi:hypothetical protein
MGHRAERQRNERYQPTAIFVAILGEVGRPRIARQGPPRPASGLGSVLLHPSDVSVDLTLQELTACGANAAIALEQAFFGLDKCRGLAKRRGGAKMLLRDRRADGADRHANDAGRLAGKGTLPVGS